MSKIKVTQADREAASDYLRKAGIEIGQITLHWTAQAFAAHRQAAMIEGARLMRGAAANVCGSLAETTYDDADGFEAATGCEAAILAIDPASVVGEGK